VGKRGFPSFSPSRLRFAIVRKCAIVRCPVEPLLLSNLGSRFLLGGRAVTPQCYCNSYNVVQCLTIYCRSLNEILDWFGLYYKCCVV
jgi:hypothetical protein